VLRDFDHMEVYLLQSGAPRTYTHLSGKWTFTISPDAVHPLLLDPDEVANISVSYDQAEGDPAWVKVTTANGVYASAYMNM
jgi:hypothetical protein